MFKMRPSFTAFWWPLQHLLKLPVGKTLLWPGFFARGIRWGYQTNIPSNNHPSVIENTGNSEGPILITAYDLIGDLNPLEAIPASSFTAGPSDIGVCLATPLQDSLQISITESNLSRGPSATEEIYYCLTNVPPVTAQTYSAQESRAWIVTL